MKHVSRRKKSTVVTAVLIVSAISTQVRGQEGEATRLLRARSEEFREEVIRVTGGVYTAVGFSVSPSSMIVGTDGVVIVDTTIDVPSAQRVRQEFRKITDKPVKAIIFTHGHGDHTGGARVFFDRTRPQVWARSTFGSEGRGWKAAGLTIQNVRGARQGGFRLPPEKRINNGIAKSYWPTRGGDVFDGAQAESVTPSHTLSEGRTEVEIAGIRLQLVAVNGETDDGLYVWLPDKRVLFSGDHFYKSWPNLYAIRGTPYRDVQAWADSVDTMLQEGAEFLIPGHTRPITGKAEIAAVLTDYRDAIRFVFEKTVEGMNKGLTPDELVEYVTLPKHMAERDYLREYYGNVEWAVRSIFSGQLGWFDGNPTNLFRLPPREEARRMAGLVGGSDRLLDRARAALKENDYQWAAQLADHLIALGEHSADAKLLKADALEALAESLLTATGRNYYLTVAQELRKESSEEQ